MRPVYFKSWLQFWVIQNVFFVPTLALSLKDNNLSIHWEFSYFSELHVPDTTLKFILQRVP